MSKGPPIAIPDLLNHVQDNTEDTWNTFPLRPSAAGFCTKRLTMDTINYFKPGSFSVPKNEARIKRLLNFGSSVEYHLIQQLSQIKTQSDSFEIRYKQQVLPLFRLIPVGQEEAPLIEGSMDFAIKLNGELIFCDAKSYGEKHSSFFKTKTQETYEKYNGLRSLERLSENGWFAADLKAFVEEAADPWLSDNLYQLNMYCLSDFAKLHGVKLGSILKYNKNDSTLYELRFTPHQGMFDEVRNKFQRAYEAALGGDPHKVSCDSAMGTARCAFCPYKDHCHGGDALKAFFGTFGKKEWPTDVYDFNGQVKKEMVDVAVDLEVFHRENKELPRHEKLEQDLCLKLQNMGVSKIRLDKDVVYELKSYKTGGVAGGPRVALKRGKA